MPRQHFSFRTGGNISDTHKKIIIHAGAHNKSQAEELLSTLYVEYTAFFARAVITKKEQNNLLAHMHTMAGDLKRLWFPKKKGPTFLCP